MNIALRDCLLELPERREVGPVQQIYITSRGPVLVLRVSLRSSSEGSPQCQKCIPRTLRSSPSVGRGSLLKEDLQEAVQFLEEDGGLVLEGATDLSLTESILATNLLWTMFRRKFY
jgi:hypothetical protein